MVISNNNYELRTPNSQRTQITQNSNTQLKNTTELSTPTISQQSIETPNQPEKVLLF